MGLDLAPAASGMCLIEAQPATGHPAVSVKVLAHEPLEIPKGFEDMRLKAKYIADLAPKYGVDAVVIEGYVLALGEHNTTAYQHAEFVSLVKSFLISMDYFILIVPPTTMRSFVKIPPKLTKPMQKRHIIQVGVDHYDFTPPYTTAKQRSDVADAFAHAVIGAHTLFAKMGKLDDSGLLAHEKRVIYGDANQNKKKPMIGMIYRPEAYINYDGAYDDPTCQEE